MATETASAIAVPAKLLRVSSKPMVMASRGVPSELISSAEPMTEGAISSVTSGALPELIAAIKD